MARGCLGDCSRRHEVPRLRRLQTREGWRGWWAAGALELPARHPSFTRLAKTHLDPLAPSAGRVDAGEDLSAPAASASVFGLRCGGLIAAEFVAELGVLCVEL